MAAPENQTQTHHQHHGYSGRLVFGIVFLFVGLLIGFIVMAFVQQNRHQAILAQLSDLEQHTSRLTGDLDRNQGQLQALENQSKTFTELKQTVSDQTEEIRQLAKRPQQTLDVNALSRTSQLTLSAMAFRSNQMSQALHWAKLSLSMAAIDHTNAHTHHQFKAKLKALVQDLESLSQENFQQKLGRLDAFSHTLLSTQWDLSPTPQKSEEPTDVEPLSWSAWLWSQWHNIRQRLLSGVEIGRESSRFYQITPDQFLSVQLSSLGLIAQARWALIHQSPELYKQSIDQLQSTLVSYCPDGPTKHQVLLELTTLHEAIGLLEQIKRIQLDYESLLNLTQATTKPPINQSTLKETQA